MTSLLTAEAQWRRGWAENETDGVELFFFVWYVEGSTVVRVAQTIVKYYQHE